VKFKDELFLVFQQNNCCPYGVKEHQQNGNVTCYSMKCEPEQATGKHAHGGGPNSVANEPGPEKSGMPPFQPLLQFFGPNPYGIKQASYVDKYYCVNERGIHCCGLDL